MCLVMVSADTVCLVIQSEWKRKKKTTLHNLLLYRELILCVLIDFVLYV